MASPVRKRKRTASHAIITLDLDCFYASVAIRSRPHLKDKPVVVVQKHLCVTSNYVARQKAHGAVQKMTPVSQALKACPDLVLIDGSDLTPFREANAEVLAVIRDFLSNRIASVCTKLSSKPFECPCQKLGFDEVFIDVSRLVEAELAVGGRPWRFAGHVFGITEDDEVRRALMIASQLAQDIRKEITSRTELTLCGGVGPSKLLAKLAINMHKPNDQTTFLPDGAREYISSLPARSLPGYGYSMELKLHEWAKANNVSAELHTAGDIVRYFGGAKEMIMKLGSILGSEAIAETILGLCQGEDNSPVRESGDAQKSITSMDSFRSCTTMEDVRKRLRVRAEDLVTRLLRDAEMHRRRPKTLTISFRFRGDGYVGTMRTTPMPMEVSSLCGPKGEEATQKALESIQRTALDVLQVHGNVSSKTKFDLTLLAIGATNFTTDNSQGKSEKPEAKISKFFGKGSDQESDTQTQCGKPRLMVSPTITRNTQQSVMDSPQSEKCPVCNRSLPRNMMQATAHVDSCLRRSKAKHAATRRTASNTRPVDSFFRKQ